MREDGFYWVKLWDNWIVGEYIYNEDGGEWCVTKRLSNLYDSDFDEIDERQIKRDESKNA